MEKWYPAMERMTSRATNSAFWRDKKVLVTGHTGFKGSWLTLWLKDMGAEIYGIALEPPTEPSIYSVANVSDSIEHFNIDIRDRQKVQGCITSMNPEIIFHLAAQPLVRHSYAYPAETFETNIMGTVNILEACRACSNLKSIVVVTSDKCYENREWDWGYRESDPMGGYDPYSCSKGCVELLSAAYRRSFFFDQGIPIATARAGNVIGGGDWSKDRLIPDILSCFEKGEPTKIRSPKAYRPWQHVLEPLSGYLSLAERLYIEGGDSYSGGWNFGPNESDVKSVEWIVSKMCELWPEDISWTFQDGAHPHEARYLKLDISKAKNHLGWLPRQDLLTALRNTIDWHCAWVDGLDMKEFSFNQIRQFERTNTID
jgi:CDP-glucose 4,6-dehydratase